MTSDCPASTLKWTEATGLAMSVAARETAPQGAFVPDAAHDRNQVAVIYNKGKTPPEITIREVSGSVKTVLADGVAVAVVASATGPELCAEDVLLVERVL